MSTHGFNENNRGERPTDRRLNSWKEIAEALGVSIRTAQIYESTRGLPIQRDGNHVSITESALRQWENGRFAGQPSGPARPVPRKRVLICIAGSLFVAMTVALVLLRPWSRSQPVAIRWNGPTLTALAADERPLWRHTFPHDVIPGFSVYPIPLFRDIDGDGGNEVLTIYPSVRREADGWDLFCFSPEGGIKWSLAMRKTVSSGQRSFGPPYVMREFDVFPSPERDGTFWTAAVFVHHVMSPSALVVVDAAGRIRGELWQDGHLNSVKAADLDGDGNVELVAGGIQEIPAQAVLLVLDPRNVHGVARVEEEQNPRQIRGMGRGTETATVYFPRTALNRAADPFNFVSRIELLGSTIQVTVVEHIEMPQGYLVYSLTPDLRVSHVASSDALIAAARRFDLDRREPSSPEMDLNDLGRRVRVVRW